MGVERGHVSAFFLGVLAMAALVAVVDLRSSSSSSSSSSGSGLRARRAGEPTLTELSDRIDALGVRIDDIQLTPGPAGPRGPPGRDGLDGERGPRGYKGDMGPIGRTGATGRAGANGRDGANGFCAVYSQETGEISVPCAASADAAKSETVQRLKGIVESLTRQIIISQTAQEQRVRFEGGSGLTQTRAYAGGSKTYHDASYVNGGIAGTHNHADHRYTVGMGEIAAVLNGVEFWTRHNDYALRVPHPTSNQYHHTVEIEYPEVPPAVTAKATGCGAPPCINDQAEEMRRWFHAWQDQDPACPSCVKLDDQREEEGKARFDAPNTVRNYAQYFQPTLCVLEGAWIRASDDIEEPFHSDRHFIEAKDWRDLYDRNRFLYASGRKSLAENLPFLPYAVKDLVGLGENETAPAFATWEYRIFCHKLKDPVPLDRFKVVTDLTTQLRGSNGVPIATRNLKNTRMARFELNPKNQSNWYHGVIAHEYIDDLMAEVPGKDNYNADLFDDAFNVNATYYYNNERLNTAYYNRYYAIPRDAMGRTGQRRSFNDASMWAAMTTQDRVMGTTACTAELSGGTSIDCDLNTVKSQKWTYAIPLEIIYLTPLSRWNPYDIADCGYSRDDSRCPALKNGRNGGFTPATAYDGTALNLWYRTPYEFFGGAQAEDTDPADTAADAVGVLDQQGVVRQCSASGHWIHFPPIVGFAEPVRQRYPIFPVHSHAAQSWKEIKALQDLLMGDDFSVQQQEALNDVQQERLGVDLKLGFSNDPNIGAHTHSLHVSGGDLALMDQGQGITVETTINNGHAHNIIVTRETFKNSYGYTEHAYKMLQCDDKLRNADGNYVVQMCGGTTAAEARANISAAVAALAPWAAYTQPGANFRNGIWHDTSGNARHSQKLASLTAPTLTDVPPREPALRFHRSEALVFANDSIPAQFTIIARARYNTDTGPRSKIFQTYADTREWFLGWAAGYLGYTRFGPGLTALSGGATDDNSRYKFHVVAGRNTAAGRNVFVDAVPSGSSNIGGQGGFTLSINGNGVLSDASDCDVSDVFIFDRHLTDQEIEHLSTLLVNAPTVPEPCCFDLHKGVFLDSN